MEPQFKFKDPAYPGVIWTLFEGPFKDEDGEEFFTFTGSDGNEGEGYITEDGEVEMVNVEYYGD